MDVYLGRTNEPAQQTPEPIDPGARPDNLFEPPPGDPGAHGIFDGRASGRSPQTWLTLHKRTALAVAAAAAGVLTARGR